MSKMKNKKSKSTSIEQELLKDKRLMEKAINKVFRLFNKKYFKHGFIVMGLSQKLEEGKPYRHMLHLHWCGGMGDYEKFPTLHGLSEKEQHQGFQF